MKYIIQCLKVSIKYATFILAVAAVTALPLGTISCSSSPADQIVWKIQDATKKIEKAKSAEQAQKTVNELQRYLETEVGDNFEDLIFSGKYTENDLDRISDATIDFLSVCIRKNVEIEEGIFNY